MATDQRNAPAFLANDADFRAMGMAIAAALQACELVQTADTGQVNWATVLKPTVANTFAGYEIYRFNDALQATKPVFIKVEYGVGTAVDRPSFAITIGTATNGAGGLVGASTGTRKQLSSGVSRPAGDQSPMVTSGGPGRIAWCFFNGASTFYYGMVVERPKTEEGVVTDEAIYTFLIQGNSTASSQLVAFGGASPLPVDSTAPALSTSAAGNPNVGQDLAVSPYMISWGKWRYAWPLAYRKTDLADLTPFQFVHLGALHTFLPLPMSGTDFAMRNVGSVHGMMIPWE